MKDYWKREKAQAEADGDAVKVAYTSWKLDPSAVLHEADRPMLELLRQAAGRFRNDTLDWQVASAMGYTGD